MAQATQSEGKSKLQVEDMWKAEISNPSDFLSHLEDALFAL